MSIESEQTLDMQGFQSIVLEGFFARCPSAVARTGQALCRYLWNVDGRCHTHKWAGKQHQRAVFSLPLHLRQDQVSKNYAIVERPEPPDWTLILRIQLPHDADAKARLQATADFSAARVEEDEAILQIPPGTGPEFYAPLIQAAREAKLRAFDPGPQRPGG